MQERVQLEAVKLFVDSEAAGGQETPLQACKPAKHACHAWVELARWAKVGPRAWDGPFCLVRGGGNSFNQGAQGQASHDMPARGPAAASGAPEQLGSTSNNLWLQLNRQTGVMAALAAGRAKGGAAS